MNEKDVARQKDVIESRKPRVLYIDIETSYAVGKFWGNRMYKVDVIDLIQPPKVIMVGWMWHGDKKAKSICLKDFPGYKPGLFNIDDRGVVDKAWDLLNEADIVIGQNSQTFDVRILNARFWHYGMGATSEFDQEDTKRNAKRVFGLPSYKLKFMLKYRGLPQKMDSGGIGTWDRTIEEGKDWNKMGVYCRNDVEVLPPLDDSMESFIKRKTIANLYTRKLNHCPTATCMSKDIRKEGLSLLKTGSKQKWGCKVCGTTWKTELIREDPKIDITL